MQSYGETVVTFGRETTSVRTSYKTNYLLVLFPDGKCFPALSGSPVLPTDQAGGLSVYPENMFTLTTQ